MGQQTFRAGAARRVITPPVGVSMSGWNPRAAGDIKAHYVHDDLYVKALVLQREGRAWALIAADLTGVDAVTTARIRCGIGEQTGLAPEAIMVCATHTHSGPAFCAVASTYSRDEIDRHCVKGDEGIVPASMGEVTTVSSSVFWVGEIDLVWKEWFVTQAIEATVEAWRSLRPAAIAFSQAGVEGVASSRRVHLSDGSWGDPRRNPTSDAQVVSRTEIDPLVRVILVHEQETQTPLAAVINYGTHPWIFCGSGISAEIAGATANRVAAAWASPKAEPPIVLYTLGPEGDVTLIWNIDVENVWKTRPEEGLAESLTRRERGFERELDRLSARLTEGVMTAIAGVERWDSAPEIRAHRQEVALPLKEGYSPSAEVLLADWQEAAPGSHLTEIQVLQAGGVAILGLPGEPLASLGRSIQSQSPFRHLVIAALANEFGAISYIGDREAYSLGGYEIAFTSIGPGAGEILVEQSITLLNADKPSATGTSQ